jgi:spermidine synthase
MNNLFFLTIIVVGFSGLIAQVLLLRELLVSFYGNELTIGVILANWVISEALGVFLIGKYIDKAKDKLNIFVILEIAFVLFFFAAIYFSRAFKNLTGIPIGEAIGLNSIFLYSFIAVCPLAFCHGALFSAGCKIYPQSKASLLGRVYSFEMLGTLIAGIIFTYVFIPYLGSFQIAFIVFLLNLFICYFLLKVSKKHKLRFAVAAMLIFGFLAAGRGGINLLQRISLKKQFPKTHLLDYRNSVYGNIAVAKEKEQYTFFYNGLPVITTPFPDRQFVEDLAHFPLLFHVNPKEVLLAGSGAGGILNEVLKHPVKNVDYVEIDPLLIEMLKKYPTELTKHELQDRRVNIINTDARFFLRSTVKEYDVILIGLSKPSDLSTNRFFTKEFFKLAKRHLARGGILAFWLPGSQTYISSELRDINASILNAAKKIFTSVRVIPGDYNIFMASESEDIINLSADAVYRRKADRGIESAIIVPDYLRYRLDTYWRDWFEKNLAGATDKANEDFKPYAVFKTLILWNKQFSPKFAPVLSSLENLNLTMIIPLVIIISVLIFLIFRSRNINAFVSYSIATTGFYGMLMNLILIFSFQIFYGYLYRWLGLLISIFMAGAALGGIIVTKRIESIRKPLRLLIIFEAVIILFSLSLCLGIFVLPAAGQTAKIIFLLAFMSSGILLGLEFPLAGKLFSSKNKGIGETAGVLYACDLLGGWVAGILGGVVLLPVLGLFNSCMVIIIVKLSSLILLGTPNNPIEGHPLSQSEGCPQIYNK